MLLGKIISAVLGLAQRKLAAGSRPPVSPVSLKSITSLAARAAFSQRVTSPEGLKAGLAQVRRTRALRALTAAPSRAR